MDGRNDLFRLEKGEEEVKKRTLATLFSPPFDFKTPRCNPAKPCFQSERPFRNLRNLVSISKHPFAPLQNPLSIFKRPFATRDTPFQNHLALSHPATPISKTIWPYCSITLDVFKTDWGYCNVTLGVSLKLHTNRNNDCSEV